MGVVRALDAGTFGVEELVSYICAKPDLASLTDPWEKDNRLAKLREELEQLERKGL